MNYKDDFSVQGKYEKPTVQIVIFQNEGVFCLSGSGSHDSFYEDDEWGGLLD